MHDVVPRALDVPGAIAIIRARARAPRARALDATSSRRGAEPWQVLSTLLGLLEMAKLGELRVAAAPTLCQRGDHA